MVPVLLGELSDTILLSSREEQNSTSSQASSSRTSNAEALRLFEMEDLCLILAALQGMTAGQSGGMSGGNVPTSSGGNTAVAFAADNTTLADNALVVWLNQSKWLDITMPPSNSLLRPPRTV